MKQYLHTIKIILFCFCLCIGTRASFASKLKAYLMMAEFLSPVNGPYIETYLNVRGNSVSYLMNNSGKYQASIEVNLVFLQKDSIKAFRKFNLLSPEYADSNGTRQNFIDVQRIPLPKGDYMMELSIHDNNASGSPLKYMQAVLVETEVQKTGMSSIEVIETMTPTVQPGIKSKNGYDLVPYVSSYFPESVSELKYYSEIYYINKQMAEGDAYLVNIYLETFENNVRIDKYYKYSRAKASDVYVVIGAMAINDLPSGNYNLVIETRDRENKLMTQQKFFLQRNNPRAEANIVEISALDISNSFVEKITDTELLKEYIRYLGPISSRLENDYALNTIKNNDQKLMRQYFLSFWQKRDPMKAEEAWARYLEQVNYVNKTFTTAIRKGYATDRGRVYLQYGKPDSRLTYDREPSSYPYELWQYYKLNNRSNRRFVFYNPDLVTNNYLLLHSDAIGEIRDDRWQTKLQKRNNVFNDFDIEKGVDQFGGNLRDAMEISK